MAADESAIVDGSVLASADGKWQRHRDIPAWLLSFALHFTTLAVLGLSTSTTPEGAADQPLRAGGIVLVNRAAGKAKYFSEEDATDSPAAAASSHVIEAQADPLPSPDAPPLLNGPQLPTSDAQLTGAQAPASMPSAGQLTTGSGSRGGPRGTGTDYGTETQVFGVPGRGSTFVYVFDRSGSMLVDDAAPLKAAKRELIASLQSLQSVHQFQIIFYNEKPQLMALYAGQRPTLVFADERGKQLAANYVGSIFAHGGTQHMQALRMALTMKPDVIFFLTDADPPELTRNELDTIRRLNRGTVINAIEFGSQPQPTRHNFLKQIAAENDGQYGYVDITRLPR